MSYTYPFTEVDMYRAAEEWGCNCGPAALAFALQIPLSKVRGVIPGFEDKGHTTPTMMKAALQKVGQQFSEAPADQHQPMFNERIALVRIQFTGPWTAPGANPRWAYRHTHWIATWHHTPVRGSPDVYSPAWGMVFDCNGGIDIFSSWQTTILPKLTANIKRADGGYFPTHIWRFSCHANKPDT